MTWPLLSNGYSEGRITVDCGYQGTTRLTNIAMVRATLLNHARDPVECYGDILGITG
jgi:hypothetical protein